MGKIGRETEGVTLLKSSQIPITFLLFIFELRALVLGPWNNQALTSQPFAMSRNGWLRICIHAILTFIFMLIMYNNLQNWSHGQTNVAFSSSSAATLPYPSVTVCPYSYNNTAEDIESITRENRLLGLNHVVDNKLNSNLYCQGAFNSFSFL